MQAADPIILATFFTLTAMLWLPLGFAYAQRPVGPCLAAGLVGRLLESPIQIRVRQAVSLSALLPQRAPPARLYVSPTFFADRGSMSQNPLGD